MNQIRTHNHLIKVVMAVLIAIMFFPIPARAQADSGTPTSVVYTPLPVVAIHISELTRSLEKMPAAGSDTPQPPSTADASGYQWFYTSWHYYVLYESIMEALRSDGTPFVTVSDADISAGSLLQPDGSPKYPIMISLAAEAVNDSEVNPLKDYVAAGGFLFVGSSAFTRYPDGRTRGDFAIADEMGVHMATASLDNWYTNHIFSKVLDHRLVAHIPTGYLVWNMPRTADEIHWGTSFYGHFVQGGHYDFKVRVSGAAVIANGSSYPLLTVKDYGKGTIIYHADLQPLIGFGGSDAGMYAYGIYRNAIEWAFEAASLPIVKLSPWQYPYDAAFIIRHDFENTSGAAIEGSAQAESAAGAKGDYYFCTGVLREQFNNNPNIVASLRQAVSLYGATIGPHNGGLKNPNNPYLTITRFDYWHWGPDEALDTPVGFAYALKSLTIAYQDIDRWLDGTDNGRPGCGAAGNCPRIWASPYFNSNREESNIILEDLNVVSAGEQKLGPFPHYTLSTGTEGLLYPQVSLPVSDWYVGNGVAQSIESGHTITTVHNLVDYYYNLGALVNLYGHTSSASGLMNVYMLYSLSKPRIWATNSVGIADWWAKRSKVTVSPTYSVTGSQVDVTAAISGSTDSDTAIELVIPYWKQNMVRDIQVFWNGIPAGADNYRATSYGIKIRVGRAVTKLEVWYTLKSARQPDWHAPGIQQPG